MDGSRVPAPGFVSTTLSDMEDPLNSVHLWLAKNPETDRITAQHRAWQEGDFPPGPLGRGWEKREVDVPAETWEQFLRGALAGSEVDALHLSWWKEAGMVGE